MKYVIGIDPDSAGVPIAVYENGNLIKLEITDLIDLYQMTCTHIYLGHEVELHIENVCSLNAVHAQKRRGNGTNMAIARRIGMCQQAQIEVTRMAEKAGAKVVNHKPSKAWKKDKEQFQKITGWEGRSNEDTRSAAYFGWLGCR